MSPSATFSLAELEEHLRLAVNAGRPHPQAPTERSNLAVTEATVTAELVPTTHPLETHYRFADSEDGSRIHYRFRFRDLEFEPHRADFGHD